MAIDFNAPAASTPATPTTTETSAPAKKEWGHSVKDNPKSMDAKVQGTATDPQFVAPNKKSTKEVKEGTEITPDAGSKPVEVKPDAQTGERKFKVKVDGKEMEVTEQELISGYALNKTSTQKMQEAAATKKQVEAFFELLKTNPKKVLTDPNLGIDMKTLAEEYLIQQYQDELDPKSAENRRLKEQLEAIESEKKAAKELEERQAIEAETQRWMDHYVKDIDGAISASTTLPKNNKAVYERVLHYMLLGNSPDYIARNGRGAEAKDVLPLVEKEFREMTTSLYKDATPEQLLEYFGEDIAKKIRKHDVSRLKNPIPEGKPKQKFVPNRKEEKPKGMQDFREALKAKDREKG